jgi:capsular exopolysaccharide synthesis family protein
MSQIFDALQRSEAEDSGTELPQLLEATELLRRAERRAGLKRESEVAFDVSVATPVVESDESIEPEVKGLFRASAQTMLRVEASQQSEATSSFPTFQTLDAPASSRDRLVDLAEKSNAAAEAFRLLGVRLRNLRRERPLKKLLITSTIPREGKSTVAANLASTLARMVKERVLLLEGDVRRPSLSELFGLANSPGICEWLGGQCGPSKAIYHLEERSIWILPAGKTPGNPLDLLQSARLAMLMEELAPRFEWIIIDSPPVLPLADTSVWARQADGILLVTRQGVTEKKQLKRGLEALEPKKLVGALLNSCTASDMDHYYYGKSSASSTPHGSSES